MKQIVVPALGESVSEATVSQWLKKEGEAVKADEPIVELETDKVTLEVNAPADGVIAKITVGEGQNVAVGAILGELEVGAAANDVKKPAAPAASTPAPAAAPAPAPAPAPVQNAAPAASDVKTSPAVRKMMGDNNIDPAQVVASRDDGRLSKEDVVAYLNRSATLSPAPASQPAPVQAAPQPAHQPPAAPASAKPSGPRPNANREERVKMTKLRQVIARRLKESQNTAATLTTFNEVDMSAIMALREEYKEAFEKKHKVKLGFMSFFVRAAIAALKEFPAVNAEIDGDEIIYKNYYDIGVAVSTPQGLVVPVVRDADKMSMAQIESKIGDLGARARDGKLAVDEMQGGTFTITNGGVFGSLMATPILNTPQTGILGMHKVMQRPMVMKDGSIQARPMMYIALSYDHRVIDGRESVSFLVRVKESIENPQRLLLDV
ncbi:MAG: 2-oxoglutarate dehydrogenase complex dihydrolipoyllysine-residue succinyltransferase [Alphaproteobacteria bacterium]|nr:2-oxoglutarate dehydrogenase complex dihydrolipoyllysine-residue succinyltransferase [Alphaproteobacteria bacterium]